MHRLLVILILALMPAWAQANPCEDILDGSSPQASQEFQQQLEEFEAQARTLIELYSKKLAPFVDPFALAYTVTEAESIYERLSKRPHEGDWAASPLSYLLQGFREYHSGERKFQKGLVEEVLDDGQSLLKAPEGDYERADYQSNLLALKDLQNYLLRFKAIEAPDGSDEGDPDQQEQESDKEGESKDPDKDPSSAGESQEEPPEYPEMSEEYEPQTNDTESQGEGSQEKHVLAEVDMNTPFFAQRHFNEIVRGASAPFREAVLPVTPQPPGRTGDTGHEMIIRTFGKSQVSLFLPPLYKPLQPRDPRAQITRSNTGGYILTLTEDLPEVHIPLKEAKNEKMPPHLRELYTRPVGFSPNEWPEKVQLEILRKYPPGSSDQPLKVAQAIADHIATSYLYSVKDRPETDPIAALTAGAFQCDMAAYAMVGLLRDAYQIPSRIGGGVRAKRKFKQKDEKSYLVVPSEGHAWVEVYHEGRWHLFDPTPVKKDKAGQGQEGEGEYKDAHLDNTPEPEPDEEPGSSSQTESTGKEKEDSEEGLEKDGEEGEGKLDHQERLDEDTKAREKSLEEDESEEESNPVDEPSDDRDEPSSSDEEDERFEEDLASQLELGSLELEPTPDRNPLIERAVRLLLRMALEPHQKGSEVFNRLNQLGSVLRRFQMPSLKALSQEALSVHEKDHPALKNWISSLAYAMPTQDLNVSYQEVYRIRKSLEVYSKTLDADGKVQVPYELLEALRGVQEQIDELAHPDSGDIGLVSDFYTNLPSLVRLLLKQTYDLDQVGPNAPTRHVAQLLKGGQLNDLRLLSILSPLTDFILNSTPRPESIEVKTWMRDTSRPTGRDLLPLQRLSDLPRAILAQPGKSVEDNLRDGTAYVPTRRRRVRIPTGHGKEEAERITIVLYDTSGSMQGDPGRFQAGLLSAFAARVLSDMAPSGKHRHRLVFVPFDTEPGEPDRVTNTQEALDVIRNYRSRLANTGGGTDVQKALLQAMALIADAEKRAGEPLAAANIIVMTDGGSPIDADELIQKRRTIDRKTPLQTMFVAINQTNEDLMRFAMDSQSLGFEQGFYREFTKQHIEDILYEADHLKKEAHDGTFYSEKDARDLSPEAFRLLSKAERQAGQLLSRVYDSHRFTPARDHLDELKKLKWHDNGQVDRPLERWLSKLRGLMLHPVFKDRQATERVVDDILVHLEKLSGVPLDQLSDYEQEQLKHLVRYAAGIEEAF